MAEDPRIVIDTLKGLLAKNKGVFLGEEHIVDIAKVAVMSHMKELREAGVTTIYVELPEYALVAMRGGEASINNLLSQGNFNAEQISKMGALMAEAKQFGIRVIGYDDTNPLSMSPNINEADLAQWVVENARSSKAMDRRDATAEYVINSTRDGGRYIVLGGAIHSRKKNVDPSAPSAGLDERLGIPSIDFVTPSLQTGLAKGGDFVSPALLNNTGVVVRKDDNFSVVKPNDGSADLLLVNTQEFETYAYLDESQMASAMSNFQAMMANKANLPLPASRNPVLSRDDITASIRPYIGASAEGKTAPAKPPVANIGQTPS